VSVLCRIKKLKNGSLYDRPTSELRVVVGAHNIEDEHEAGQRRHSVERAVVHEEFHYVYITPVNDIMLLKLSPRIQFNKNVKPICVDDSVFPPGTQCMVTGWGSTQLQCKNTHTRIQPVQIHFTPHRCH